MSKEFTISLNAEQVNYLQRLGAEVDSKVFIIDRLFANHATDTDTQLFDSIPYKHYMSEYEKAYVAWELAKNELETTVIRPAVIQETGNENPSFSWIIEDYNSLECKVTLTE